MLSEAAFRYLLVKRKIISDEFAHKIDSKNGLFLFLIAFGAKSMLSQMYVLTVHLVVVNCSPK